jgi:MFS family permease
MDLEPQEPPGPSLRPSWSGRLRSLALDLTPLKESRDFRLLWAGSVVSFIGSGLTFVAIPFQVFELTDSTLAVGLLGVAELVPLLLLSLLGGALADRVDRRRLLLATEGLGALASVGLALNARSDDPQLWLIYLLTTAIAVLYALGSPAFRSATPLLIRRELLPAAAALEGVSQNLSSVVGPALAGVLIGTIGLTGTYVVDAASFLFILGCIFLIRPIPPRREEEDSGSVLEGLRFLKGRPVLQGSFIVDIIAMVFGMPNALFPAIARGFGGPAVLGLLYAAPSGGALLASLTSGWTGKVRRQGLATYLAVIAWGLSLVLFGFANALWLAVVALALAGAADMISAIFRHTILQTAAPPHLVGRLSGLELSVVASGPALGDLEAGALAALTSVRFSVVGGGIACVVGVGIMHLALPEFARYDAEHPTP